MTTTRRTRPPRCSGCGGHYNVHAVSLPGRIPGADGGLRWLCADCEYRELNPDAELLRPWRKPKRPQSETLW